MSFKNKQEFLIHEIKSLIKEKKLKPGDRLPTELNFQEMYNVSRHTVRLALMHLENDGIIYKEQGVGSFVANSKKNNSKEIGVITTYISDYIFPYIIRGIEKEITREGFTMILASTNNDITLERKAVEMMLSRNVAGLIIEPTKSALYNPNIGLYLKIKEQNIPTIMINANYDEVNIPVVKTDDYNSGYIATQELIDNNHVNIGGIFKIDDKQGKERLKGYLKACFDNKVEYNSENIIVYETKNIEKIVSSEVDKMIIEKRVTGIVCYNDKIATAVQELIWQHGFSIPKDFSIISHDNSYLSEMKSSLFSSVDHPKSKLGQLAACKVIESIKNGQKPINDYIYRTKLIRRSSVKKLK